MPKRLFLDSKSAQMLRLQLTLLLNLNIVALIANELLVDRIKPRPLLAFSFLSLLLTGCSSTPLPPCVQGLEAPTKSQQALWSGVEDSTQMDLGIDGSGSMLGLTGSAVARDAWRSLIQGVKLASANQGLTINSKRVGGGKLTSFDNPGKAINPCFFTGCGPFLPVTSSLDSLWNSPGLTGNKIPLNVLISDLEVNNGDISKLIKSTRPHAKAGAVIGVLALKLPFDGKVFNSRGAVIYQGDASRPVYILASGPQSQVRPLLQSIKSKISVGGLNTSSMKLTYLEDWVNRKTLTAKSLSGVSSGVPLRFGKTTYSPSGTNEYQFAKLKKGLNSLTLSSNAVVSTSKLASVNIGSLQTIQLPGFEANLNGVSDGGVMINGSDLVFKVDILNVSDSKALRAVMPRGQLPEDWWIKWDRKSMVSESPQDQTDGLLQLMTSLGELFVDPQVTPAASFCLLTNS